MNDLAYLTIDFKADFSSLFDWNTKQLFIFIFAEYSTANNVWLIAGVPSVYYAFNIFSQLTRWYYGTK